MTTTIPITLQLVGVPVDPVLDPEGDQRWCVVATAGRIGTRVRLTESFADADTALEAFATTAHDLRKRLAEAELRQQRAHSADRAALEVLAGRMGLVATALRSHTHVEKKRGDGRVDVITPAFDTLTETLVQPLPSPRFFAGGVVGGIVRRPDAEAADS